VPSLNNIVLTIHYYSSKIKQFLQQNHIQNKINTREQTTGEPGTT